MPNNVAVSCRQWLLLLTLSFAVVPCARAGSPGYGVNIADEGSVRVSTSGERAEVSFAPVFTVISRDSNPGYRLKREAITNYAIPVWKAAPGGKDNHNLFAAGEAVVTTATGVERSDGATYWQFPENARFSLTADVSSTRSYAPHVTVHFTPKKKGWYSVGYTGAPSASPLAIDALWQPHVWQERRFPDQPFLSVESMCSLPAVFAEAGGSVTGVCADPAESPYRLPTSRNSRFGMMLRNQAGEAQPMIFAPVLGGADSEMEAGRTYGFRFYLINQRGNCITAFRSMARTLFGFHDYRENSGCSLNKTLENMIDFAMNDSLSGWIEDLKGSDYSTDVPGSVKNVSALHPLSIALITHNKDIYRRRGLPMTEYLLSRQKYLFGTREDVTHQGASHLMRGPAAEVSELVSLFHMFSGKTEVFRHYAKDLFDKPRALNLNMVSEGASWQNALALYRLTDDAKYLEQAVAGADAYIARRMQKPEKNFSDVRVTSGGQFWTDYAPKWVDLFELYEETSSPRHLAAAVAGASSYATYAWMHPKIPEGDVRVNARGQVPVYNKRQIKDPQPMPVPEQDVPAWRVSQIGLTPEASRTHQENPAIFLAHYAAYMLRLAHAANDPFLHDLARAAIVGRYQNFPGYDLNGEFTTVYSRPDYPLRPYRDLTYNNIYYNHIWPHIALMMDYLVSDAFVKSAGRINFPSRYAQGYAFLSSKVYGDRPGSFYGEENVRLWLPRQLLSIDNIQANYIAGYGNGNFYVALLNQSSKEQQATVTLNPDVVALDEDKPYAVRVLAGNSASPAMQNAKIAVTIAPHSITAFAVDGLDITPQFQQPAPEAEKPASSESFAVRETEIGKVTTMLLSMGPDLTNAFVWLEATPRQVSQATLYCKQDDTVTTSIDSSYPFEFSIPIARSASAIELSVDAVTTAGKAVRSAPVRLEK